MKLKPFIISFWIIILFPTLVLAYYKDKEQSVGNTFAASTLDTVLYDSSSNALELQRGDSVSLLFKLKNTGELNTSNTQIVTDISNTTLADAVQVSIHIDGGPVIYTSTLSSFNMQNFLEQVHNQVNLVKYSFYISADDYDANPASVINFRIINKSWESTLTAGNGFTDTESITVSLLNSTPLPLFNPTVITQNPVTTLIELINPTIE